MFFDRLLDRVAQRITDYRRSGRPDSVLGDEVLAEAAELWQAARPADPEYPTPEDNQRLAAAHHALGCLHYLRCTALPVGPDYFSEVARAVVYLAPVAHNPDTVPIPLQVLLGAAADAASQANVAADLLRHVETRNDPALLDAAILLLTDSIAAPDHGHPDRVGWLSNLGLACLLRLDRGGEPADLDRAIGHYREAVAATPADHPYRAGWLFSLGRAYKLRFERGGAPGDLDQAIENYQRAVAAPRDHPDRARSMSNLGVAFRERFDCGRAPADLDKAIEIGAQAVTTTPRDHPDRAAMLSNLGLACLVRFGHSEAPSDLDQAIENYRQAVAAPHDHPDRPVWRFNLGYAYERRVERGGPQRDLDEAFENYQQAVAAAPAGHPALARYLSNLGNAYRARFERRGVLADLEQAVEIGTQAVAATPDDHPNRAAALANLGNAYGRRFDRHGEVADLDRAIEIGTQAVAATPDDYPDRARHLSNLGGYYLVRFERRADVTDLDHAIEIGTLAVAATADDRPDRATALANLSLAYWSRFDRRGAPADLDHAIEIGTRAVAAAPDGHLHRAGYLSNLGGAYETRFERRGVLADLDQAINLKRQALAATPDDHPSRTGYLFNLGSAYQERSKRLGAPADLDQAVNLKEQALAATPDGHPNQAMMLSGLGGTYQERFKRGGALADLDQAIKLEEQAVAATPDDHPGQAKWLSNVGVLYRMRFAHRGVLADLDHAIEIGTQAVAATPDDHPNQAVMLSNLGSSYRARLDLGGQDVDSHTLRTLARQVTAAATAPAANWVDAAGVVGSLAHAANEHDLAAELLDAAVSLMPSIAPREAEWADQEHRLGEFRGLIGETIAAHCAINDPVGAVEAAELGRGVLLAARLDSRSDLTDLDHAHPHLAAEFRRIRDQLNTQAADTSPASPSIDPVGQIEHRKHSWAEYDQLLAQIRQQPGFTRFLRSPRLADLRPATAGGAAILVNTGSRRSDAIIITADADPVLVALPDATAAAVTSHAQAFLEAIHDNSPVGTLRRQRVVPKTLGWLWDAIVEPVLNELPPIADGTSTLRRVWWLPIGVLGLFPLHAAGYLGQPGALDAVISSYTPTLRTLAHARTRAPTNARRQLTVALHHTPGLSDLAGTVTEATTLHTHHPDTPLLLDETATTSRVLAALPETTWAHFACHASVNLTAPSQGGLVLHDATLALPQISQLHLSYAELAYLSACSTADRGLQLADESLHLASAFQLAGFRHVVASLWPLNDHIAATTAAALYRHLPDTPTADHAATALHHVTRELRDTPEYSSRPDLWAALIHSGP